MLYRSFDKGDGSFGKWLGVGGKVEKGETADECFIRETLEETGIRLEPSQLRRRGIVDFDSTGFAPERMFLYTAEVSSDSFQNCDEGELSWIKEEKVLTLDMWEGDHLFLEKLMSNEDKGLFAMTLRYGGESGEELTECVDGRLSFNDVDSLEDEKLKCYIGLNENQLRHIYEPEKGLFIAETPVVIERAVNAGYEAESFFCEYAQLFEATKYEGVTPIFCTSSELMSKLTGYSLIHGMLCAMKRRDLPVANELTGERLVVLEDVVNPTNVGAIVRNAAALSIDGMILTRASADPLYRRAIRVSMGNIFSLPYAVEEDLTFVDELKTKGFRFIAMALSENAYEMGSSELDALKKEKLAIVMGTESTGISKELLDKCDYVVKIPMQQGVDSLNVAAASAVAFWEFRKKK